MPPPALRFAGVGKRYGRSVALDDLTLEVRHGECFGLVGVNGAGKTTLIKCLLDFCDMDAGSIDIYGVPHREERARAALAFLPERFNPPYYLTGRDFIAFVLSLQGTPYVPAAVHARLAALDLDPAALARPVRTYSKGMTQKLGLAACLAARKDLYVLDEPTSGLDPRARARLKAELQRLRAEGHTVFFTSHALADVAEMCDRMALVHAGRLRFAGTPAELATRYGAADLERAFLACVDEAEAVGASIPA
ncbi:MAG: ABC transporter ATP-binding protein [Burkholderiales bacterium]